jgi:hypothetical protein
VLTFAVAGVTPAQEVSTPQGLFGRAPSDTAQTKVDVSASVVGGYDSDVPTNVRGAIDPSSLQAGGFSTLLNAGAAYGWKRSDFDIGANANSSVRHYADVGQTRVLGHAAGVGLSARLPSRVTLKLDQTAAYSPTFFYGLFPSLVSPDLGAAGVTAPDYSVSNLESYVYATSASLSRDLSRRSRISGYAAFQYDDRQQETDTWNDVSAHFLRGQFGANLTRNIGLDATLRYRSGEFGYGSNGRTTELGLDGGIVYSRPLSGTRRLEAQFSGGLSRADYPPLPQATDDVRRQYIAVVNGALGYQFRRWELRATGRRGLEYVSDLPEPVVALGGSFGVVGFLSRRVDLSMTAAYSTGESALNRTSLSFDTYTGDIKLRYALSRSFAIFAEYLQYYYDFRGSAQLFDGIPAGLKRNGVRVGLNMWMPALRR